MNLTTKEQGLLKDLQSGEKLCTEKYQKAAAAACDPVLQGMFSKIAGEEQGHYDTVTQMLSGVVPTPKSKQQPEAAQKPDLQSKADCAGQQADQYLLKDLLSTEKYIAGVYNVSVFEFSDEQARQVLNDIQTQEQNHGKQLSDYMQANGMYC